MSAGPRPSTGKSVRARSAGLKELLKTDAAYAQRYLELTSKVATSTYTEVHENYPHTSWRNRKWVANQRGIEWNPSMKSFKGFLLIMGPMPRPGMTLDRINFKGPYSPLNVRWATRRDQDNNKGDNIRIPVRGKLMTITEVAEFSGKIYDAIRMGIKRHGYAWAADLVATVSFGLQEETAWQFSEPGRAELEAELLYAVGTAPCLKGAMIGTHSVFMYPRPLNHGAGLCPHRVVNQ